MEEAQPTPPPLPLVGQTVLQSVERQIVVADKAVDEAKTEWRLVTVDDALLAMNAPDTSNSFEVEAFLKIRLPKMFVRPVEEPIIPRPLKFETKGRAVVAVKRVSKSLLKVVYEEPPTHVPLI